MRLRSGRGLGDSIYLRVIAEEFMRRRGAVTVLSNYPDVFIGSGAQVEPFIREHSTRCKAANYTNRMKLPETQFESMLRSVGLPDIPMRFAWKVRNAALCEAMRLNARGKPIVLVHGGRIPMQRSDTWTKPLMPRQEAFETALTALDGCFRLRVGNDRGAYGMSVDMVYAGTISDLIDLFSICDGVVAQCSFAIPLAECFDKPLLAIWSIAGLKSLDPYLRLVTPQKVLQDRTMTTLAIDYDLPTVDWLAREFNREIAQPEAVAA